MGAAIAAGSQAQKGSCALLVIAANNIIRDRNVEGEKAFKLIIQNFHDPSIKIKQIANSKKISPKRLVRRVNILAFCDFLEKKNMTKRYETSPRPSHPSINIIISLLKIKINMEIRNKIIIIRNRK